MAGSMASWADSGEFGTSATDLLILYQLHRKVSRSDVLQSVPGAGGSQTECAAGHKLGRSGWFSGQLGISGLVRALFGLQKPRFAQFAEKPTGSAQFVADLVPASPGQAPAARYQPVIHNRAPDSIVHNVDFALCTLFSTVAHRLRPITAPPATVIRFEQNEQIGCRIADFSPRRH